MSRHNASPSEQAAGTEEGGGPLGVESEIDRLITATAGKFTAAHDEVARLQRELEETNRGVVALVAELDDAARQWQTTFDAITDGVCQLDEAGRIVRANQALSRIAGADVNVILGCTLDQALEAAFGDVGLSAWVMPARTAGRRVMEVRVGPTWFELRLYPVPEDGDRGRQSVLVVSDISERKLYEEQQIERSRSEREAANLREHAARMAALEKVKSEFLKLASHELRGPMAVLKGYIDMLADGSLGTLPAPAREVLPVLSTKAFEVDLLIEQMLETARLEDSRLLLTKRDVDIRTLVIKAGRTMEPLAAATHRLVIGSHPERIIVNVDPIRIGTILTNLLENAIKYSPHGGDVTAEIAPGDGCVRVSVADQGLGILPEDLPKLFTRFGRLVTDENSHIQGTGLGLYLSREIARMHGGDVTCTSTAGQGSTFTLTLPLPG